MNIFVLLGIILFAIGLALIFLVIIFSTLKHLKKNYYPNWKYLDYVSVGYFEHLYRKFIKRV